MKSSQGQMCAVSTGNENGLVETKKQSETDKDRIPNRKSLHTIQLSAKEGDLSRSANGQGLAGKAQKSTGPSKGFHDDQPTNRIMPSKKSVMVFEDPATTVIKKADKNAVNSACGCGCHNDKKPKSTQEEAYELMVQEDIPETYWKDVAERRRLGLADALQENKQLHQEVEQLQEENQRLTNLAEQAEYFASMLKMLTEDGLSEGTVSDDDEAQDLSDRDDKDDSTSTNNQETSQSHPQNLNSTTNYS